MFAFFFQQNAFFLVEAIVNSVLLLGCAWVAHWTYSVLNSSRDSSISDDSWLYLKMTGFHLLIQLGFYFIYPFTALLYTARFLLCVQILFIANDLVSWAEFISAGLKARLKKAIEYLIVLSIGLLLVNVLKIRVKNECGQQLTTLYSLFIIALLISLVALLVLSISQINEQIRSTFVTGLMAAEGAAQEAGLVTQLKQQRDGNYRRLIVLGISLFFQAALTFAKYRRLGSSPSSCASLFSGHGTFFAVVFSLFEFLAMNAANGLIYYDHFYKLKGRFLAMLDFSEKITEAFDSKRSAFLAGSIAGLNKLENK